ADHLEVRLQLEQTLDRLADHVLVVRQHDVRRRQTRSLALFHGVGQIHASLGGGADRRRNTPVQPPRLFVHLRVQGLYRPPVVSPVRKTGGKSSLNDGGDPTARRTLPRGTRLANFDRSPRPEAAWQKSRRRLSARSSMSSPPRRFTFSSSKTMTTRATSSI